WWFAFRELLQSNETIALNFAGLAFNILLFLHLRMRFVILPLQRRRGKQNGEEHHK
ncbi:membrane protein, partial [Vibrio parahaemolyticus]|uniref:DUF3624 family protein n=1 Tax=Vibrio parahaemolyticus TaxID=670 RepID=UPI00062B2986